MWVYVGGWVSGLVFERERGRGESDSIFLKFNVFLSTKIECEIENASFHREKGFWEVTAKVCVCVCVRERERERKIEKG